MGINYSMDQYQEAPYASYSCLRLTHTYIAELSNNSPLDFDVTSQFILNKDTLI